MGSLLTVSSDVWLWKSPLIPQASVSFAMRAQGTSRLESQGALGQPPLSLAPLVFLLHISAFAALAMSPVWCGAWRGCCVPGEDQLG